MHKQFTMDAPRGFVLGVAAVALAWLLVTTPTAQSRSTVVQLDSSTLNQLDQMLQIPLLAIQANTKLLKGPLPVTQTPNQDPCFGTGKGNAAISQTATTRYVVGRPGARIAGCASRVIAAAAEILGWIEGTGTNCATGASAVTGSTTAANSESYLANGGYQANGPTAFMMTNVPGDDLCLQQSGSQRLAGNLVYTWVVP